MGKMSAACIRAKITARISACPAIHKSLSIAKKFIRNKTESLNNCIISNPLKTAIFVFISVALITIILSLSYYSNDFYENVLVELHGLVLDLLVIGTIVLWIDLRRAKSNEINRNIELIQDFSAWHSDESAIRVFGAYNRLRKFGVVHPLVSHYLNNIHSGAANFSTSNLISSDFTSCRLPDADFRFSRLKYTIFAAASLQGADFRGANLFEADMRGCDLTFAKFSETIIQAVKFDRSTTLDRTNLKDAYLYELDLRTTNLDRVDLRGVRWQSVLFPPNFSPVHAGMIEVTEPNYPHPPLVSLLKRKVQVLQEPVSILDKITMDSRS